MLTFVLLCCPPFGRRCPSSSSAFIWEPHLAREMLLAQINLHRSAVSSFPRGCTHPHVCSSQPGITTTKKKTLLVLVPVNKYTAAICSTSLPLGCLQTAIRPLGKRAGGSQPGACCGCPGSSSPEMPWGWEWAHRCSQPCHRAWGWLSTEQLHLHLLQPCSMLSTKPPGLQLRFWGQQWIKTEVLVTRG